MKVYNTLGSVKRVIQKLRAIDDNIYFYLNGSKIAESSGFGSKNQDITWDLVPGLNLLQIITNNSGGVQHYAVLLGDIINNSDTYFVEGSII
jgi:hypothetical protein